MATDLRTRLVLDALNMAVTTRKPADVVHQSDEDIQYTSLAFGFRCKEKGVRPSTGSVGDAYDNTIAEAFFATLECELLDRRSFRSQAEARLAAFHFIEGFYNPTRLHSAPGLFLTHRIRCQSHDRRHLIPTRQPSTEMGQLHPEPQESTPPRLNGDDALLLRPAAKSVCRSALRAARQSRDKT